MSSTEEKPLSLIAFVSDDLMLTSKLENAGRQLGYHLTVISDPTQITDYATAQPMTQPDHAPPAQRALAKAPIQQDSASEPMSGLAAELFELITRQQPNLLIFDLAQETLPWQTWIRRLKSSPATRRLPILCFGPHVDVERMTTARKIGADQVVARSRFFSGFVELVEGLAHQPDYTAVAQACQQPLSELARAGLHAFNTGDYYEAHEHLEDAWNADSSPAKELYRGILQVAVAYLQIERGNYRGAVKMFLRARQWLDPLPDQCRGIDIAQLKEDAEAVYEQLLGMGAEQIAEFDPTLFRPVIYIDN